MGLVDNLIAFQLNKETREADNLNVSAMGPYSSFRKLKEEKYADELRHAAEMRAALAVKVASIRTEEQVEAHRQYLLSLTEKELEIYKRKIKRNLQQIVSFSASTSKTTVKYANLPELQSIVDKDFIDEVMDKLADPTALYQMAHIVGELSVEKARAIVPYRTGVLHDSIYYDIDTIRIKSIHGRDKTVIVKVKSDVDYARVIHSGRSPKYGYIPPRPFLGMQVVDGQMIPAIRKVKKSNEARVFSSIEKLIDEEYHKLREVQKNKQRTSVPGDIGVISPFVEKNSTTDQPNRARAQQNVVRQLGERRRSTSQETLRQSRLKRLADEIAAAFGLDPSDFLLAPEKEQRKLEIRLGQHKHREREKERERRLGFSSRRRAVHKRTSKDFDTGNFL